MLAIALLVSAALFGSHLSRALTVSFGASARAGVGLALGQGLQLWLPFLLAAAFGLSARAAGLAALGVLASGVSVLAWVQRSASARLLWRDEWRKAWHTPGQRSVWVCSAAWLGLFVYLCHTHYLVPRVDGLHSAGVTWGDLPIHLALASHFAAADGLPPLEHPLIANGPLSYPFVPDYGLAVLTALGLPLRWAFILGGLQPMAALVLLLPALASFWLEPGDRRVGALALGLF
ncbi:MAG: hypothetical protein ABW321_26450, partial [Polyangiales bacterium]